ncbi:MAG: hypothetical protein ACRDYX_06920 [Egibacteraceae bacterium]
MPSQRRGYHRRYRHRVLDTDGDAFIAAIGHARKGGWPASKGTEARPSEAVHDPARIIADTLLG